MTITFDKRFFEIEDQAQRVIRQLELARDPHSGRLYLEDMPGYRPTDPFEKRDLDAEPDDTLPWAMCDPNRDTGFPDKKTR
jgi:hypothetical protein